MASTTGLLIIERILRDRESIWRQIDEERDMGRLIRDMLVSSSAALACYGAVLGASNSHIPLLQALVSALKLPMLFLVTLAICLPTLYLFNLVFGARLQVRQALALVLVAITVISTMALAFAPISLFFLITANHYSFYKLLNVAILTLSAFVGLRFLTSGMKALNRMGAVRAAFAEAAAASAASPASAPSPAAAGGAAAAGNGAGSASSDKPVEKPEAGKPEAGKTDEKQDEEKKDDGKPAADTTTDPPTPVPAPPATPAPATPAPVAPAPVAPVMSERPGSAVVPARIGSGVLVAYHGAPPQPGQPRLQPMPAVQSPGLATRPGALPAERQASMTLLYVWIMLFGFVGTQLAWTLRPFFGSPGEKFQIFRSIDGNFYVDIVRTLGELF